MELVHIVEKIEKEGWKAHLLHDEQPTDPWTEYDHFGHMYCWHRRYQLGDPHSASVEDVREDIRESRAEALPLYLYDHSGITMSTGRVGVYADPWDAGQVGYIFATAEEIIKEYGNDSEESRLKARDLLEAQVEEYDHFLTGECYGIRIEDPDGHEWDTCWGHLGYDYAKEEAQRMLDYAVEHNRDRIPDAAWVAAAKARFPHMEDIVLFDPTPTVRLAEDGHTACVQAWIWVPKDLIRTGET